MSTPPVLSTPQSALCSIVGIMLEAAGLVILRRHHSATINTVIGGTLVRRVEKSLQEPRAQARARVPWRRKHQAT